MKRELGIVAALGALLLWSPAARAQVCIRAYEHANYGGEVSVFCNGGEPVRNDSYSSFRVPRGMRVRVFEHGDGSGRARTYFEDVPWCGALLEDQVSSLRWGPFAVDDFAVLTASDPQLSWGYCDDDPSTSQCADERRFFAGKSNDEIGRTYNANLVGALNGVGAHFGESHLMGAIVNGDLTEFGDQGPDLGDYIALYERGLAMNVYLGLGNHDYQNNVDDCGNNTCASTMVTYLRDQVQSLGVQAFDYSESGVYYQFPVRKKRHEGSLGYSWNVGDVHFVQLNNHPLYERSWSTWNWGGAFRDEFQIRRAMAWLRDDLRAARDAGRTIVINLHDWGAVRGDAELRAMLNEFPVSAIYAGHWHSTIGQWEMLGPFADGRSVPVLFSGSAHYGSFLVTRFTGNRMRVWVMRVDHFNGARLRVLRNGGEQDAGDLGALFGAQTWTYEYSLR